LRKTPEKDPIGIQAINSKLLNGCLLMLFQGADRLKHPFILYSIEIP
jgi:hypothetical protein